MKNRCLWRITLNFSKVINKIKLIVSTLVIFCKTVSRDLIHVMIIFVCAYVYGERFDSQNISIPCSVTKCISKNEFY